VRVLERLDAPGGRAYVRRQDGYTFDCGCTVDRMFPMLSRLPKDDLDYIFEDGHADITCPRCGAKYKAPRELFEQWFASWEEIGRYPCSTTTKNYLSIANKVATKGTVEIDDSFWFYSAEWSQRPGWPRWT
jgi:phytoene dehydrogenase-like protein